MSDEGWVVGIRDDDAGDAFGAAVSVEGVGYGEDLAGVARWWEGKGTFFFDVLSLAGFCSFGHGFAEEGHELAIAGALSDFMGAT